MRYISDLLPIICFALIAAAYVAWRVWHVARIRNAIVPVLPPENRLSWNVSASRCSVSFKKSESNRKSESKTNSGADEHFDQPRFRQMAIPQDGLRDFEIAAWGAAASDGLIQALPVALAFGHIDPEVLKAIEFSTAEHIHGLTSVDAYISDHFFSQADPSAEGWLHRLEGYVAEQKAAAVLEQAGHHVEFPETPNHPDVDFYVDGAPWQIKEGSSALAQVKDFLAQHDGIDIGTTPDIAAAINHPHVHGIPELDHDTIASSTKDSLHGVKDGFHSGLHFPVITFGFSSYREIKLLWNEKTTIERALKNVVVDVAGVGAGAFAGAKAGALAGVAFGPHGAAAGAIIGSIAGAIGGKKVANAVRFSAFEKAKVDYLKAVETAQDAIRIRIEQSRSEIKQLQEKHEAAYEEERSLILRHTESRLSAVQRSCEAQLEVVAETFPARLDAISDQLQRQRNEVLSLIPSSVLAFAFPRRTDVLRSVVDDWFHHAIGKVAAEKEHFLALQDRSQKHLRSEIRRFLAVYEFELDDLTNDIRSVVESFESAKQDGERIRQEAIVETKAVRTRLLRAFGVQVSLVEGEIAKVIEGWKRQIGTARSVLKREATPLGIEIP